MIVTPHLGASTAEATDRAGYQAAEQVIAALTGGVVTSAVNVPAIPAEDMEVLGPFVPLCRSLGRIAIELARGSSIDRVHTEFLGRIAERDTRLLSIQVLLGALRGHTEEEVNEVNAPAIAEERGIELAETKRTQARDYTDLIRVSVTCGDDSVRVAGTLIGRRNRAASARGVGPAVRRPARGPHHAAPLPRRPGHDRPRRHDLRRARRQHRLRGGRPPARRQRRREGRLAAMAITTDTAVPHEVVDEIVAGEGFVAGRTHVRVDAWLRSRAGSVAPCARSSSPATAHPRCCRSRSGPSRSRDRARS